MWTILRISIFLGLPYSTFLFYHTSHLVYVHLGEDFRRITHSGLIPHYRLYPLVKEVPQLTQQLIKNNMWRVYLNFIQQPYVRENIPNKLYYLDDSTAAAWYLKVYGRREYSWTSSWGCSSIMIHLSSKKWRELCSRYDASSANYSGWDVKI